MFTLLDERIAFWKQRRLGKRGEYNQKEQSEEEHYWADLGSADVPLVTYCCRHDHIEEVDVMPNEDHDPSHDQDPADALEIGIDQDQDREHEVHDHGAPEKDRIIIDPLDEISNFFRNVRVPDQHELREPKVGPENAESKNELRKIVDMARVDKIENTFRLKVKRY